MEHTDNSLRRIRRLIAVLAVLVSGLAAANAVVPVATDGYPLVFPVAGETTYTDTWDAPRSEGRTHKGADIFAAKGTPVVAAAEGTVMRMTVGKTAGRYIVVEHIDGWRSYYLHLDNDTPGSDDGAGGAPAPGIEVGSRVAAGDILDYVGDSGNAEETPSHLHFELHRPDGTAINPTPHLYAAESATADGSHPAGTEWSTAALPPSYHASGIEMVGHFDPGGGFAAGLAVHSDVAYLGTWGRPNACPGSGVRLIGVENPVAPALVATIADAAEFPGTSTDSMWVGAVDTDAFSGDLAVIAIRLCDTSERNRWRDTFRGLAIYDVTDPEHAELLSTVSSGAHTQGANEIAAAVQPDGTLIVAATVMQSLPHTDGHLGDLRLIDVTDPRNPLAISDWDPRRDLGLDLAEMGAAAELHVHNVSFGADGMTAWLAAWDAGVVALDLAKPEDPVVIAHVPVKAGAEGNVHTVVFNPDSGLLIRNDEDLDPRGNESVEAGWGGQQIYDVAEPTNVRPVAEYRSPGSVPNEGELDYSGFFSAHEVVVVADIEYVSWYSDGLRVIDLSDPSAPSEIGSFIPPAVQDPQGHWLAPDRNASFPMVWGVAVVDGLIFLSDVHSGLWIVRTMPDTPTATSAI